MKTVISEEALILIGKKLDRSAGFFILYLIPSFSSWPTMSYILVFAERTSAASKIRYCNLIRLFDRLNFSSKVSTSCLQPAGFMLIRRIGLYVPWRADSLLLCCLPVGFQRRSYSCLSVAQKLRQAVTLRVRFKITTLGSKNTVFLTY